MDTSSINMRKLLSNYRAKRYGICLLLIAAILFSPLPLLPTAEAQTAPRLALVTRTSPAPGSDQPYLQHLRDRGWNVTLITDDRIRNVGRSAVSGYDLVVVSSSVFADRIESRLRDAPEPIIVAEHDLFPAFGLTGSTKNTRSNSDWGFTTASRRLNIVDPNHPIAAGLRGQIFVSTKAKPMNYGRAGSDAYVIATAKDSSSQDVVFAYESGDRLANGQVARGPRVAIYMNQKHPGFANRDGWAIFDAAAAWASPNAPSGSSFVASFNSIALDNGTLLGGNIDKENYDSRYESVLAFERQIRRKLDFVNRFHEFSAGLTSSFFWDRKHVEDGRTVMVSWRATDNPGSVNGQPDPRRASKIVAGQFDAEIEAMATTLRDLEAPVLLRFNWEMDQDIGDPQNIGTPQEFIAAWRYVHRIFQERGATNVEWVWSPRARSFAKGVGQTFYPGYDYVDWIGGSAVPVNSFTDPETIYSAWNQWASNIGKPQLLWVGLRENPNDSAWKSRFINQLRNLATGQWSGLKALIYYNSNSPLGNDYTIDTSSASLSAFRNLVCNSQFTRANKC